MVTNKQTHVIPSVAECQRDFQTTNPRQFVVEVRQYRKQIAEMEIYLCTEELIDKL